MSFPRYPKYKDSGVEWFGEVPEHWQVKRLSNVSEILAGHPFDSALFGLDGIPVIRMSDFGDGQVHCDEAKKVEPLHVPKRSLAQSGDALLGLSGSISNFAIVRAQDLPVAINQRVAMVRTANSNCSLLKWFLQSAEFSNQLASVLPETTIQNISMGQLRCCILPYPPIPEQNQIAAFLDRETAKIDALVAEQRRLLELLKEKRQAVISHAVTQGLNPHAPMKPSGIEWLGDVPAHWEVKRLKQLTTKLTDGEHISPMTCDEGVPLLSAKDVRDWQIDYDVDKFVTPENATTFWKRCRPERGDVLVVSRGATVGRIGVVELDFTFCLMGSVILCKPTKEFDQSFLYFALNAKHAQTSLWFSSASSAQQAIYIRDVAEVPVPIPPPIERIAICAFLKAELVTFETLTTEAQHTIDLLLERRSALISAAVTGQIDVRQLAGMEAA